MKPGTRLKICVFIKHKPFMEVPTSQKFKLNKKNDEGIVTPYAGIWCLPNSQVGTVC